MPRLNTAAILIVEDDPDDRVMLRRMLRERADRFTVTEETSATAALERCRAEMPDCVLLDYHMPEMTGSEFLDALRELGEGALPVAVAVFTGREDNDVAAEVLGRGAQDYLVKGTVTGLGLVRAIDNSIQKFRVQQELDEKRAALEVRNFQLESLRDQLQGKLAELAEATQAKEQFLAVMSHEMRTPLNAILGYVDLLEMGIGAPLAEGQRPHVDRIRVGGRHLLDLINDVLDLARTDAQKLELDLRPVDLSAVLEEVTSLLSSQADEKGLYLDIAPCAGTLPPVQADLRRLRQILTNLVGNAIKFTDEGGITLRCRVEGHRVALEVEDTGIGIEPDLLALVFTEFYQVRGELTRAKGGSGLGLTISQRLARMMGGDIVVRSVIGKGSTFKLTLPVAVVDGVASLGDAPVDEAYLPPQAAPAAAAPDTDSGPSIVVAFSSDADSLEELARRVTPDVRLEWTTDPDAVLEMARDVGASLVVLDITCAEGAAWHIAHTIPSVPELASAAVLLLPRLPRVEASAAGTGLDLGWVSLVPKPYTQEQLSLAVSHAARNTPTAASPDTGDDGGRPMEILLVDDDPDSRRVAANILQVHDVVVREAADGESALIAMRRRRPDVVVLDLMMPVLDGFGVLATMRADPQLIGIPVVVLSAKSLSEDERRFLARTAVRVLEKGEHRLTDVAALVLRAAARAAAHTDAAPSADGGADAG
jgi:signal transduction histidine kinase